MNTTTSTQETITNIVKTLKIQNAKKRDMIVPASKLNYHDGHIWVTGKGGITDTQGFRVNEVCHQQIAEKLDIPTKYYKRMRSENVQLLDDTINSWLGMEKNAKYMLRCLQGIEADEENIARAFLSDRYNCIDNYDILAASLDAIKRMKVKVDVLKAEVTDKRFYLQVACPEIEQEAEKFLRDYLKTNDGVGNGIISGLSISNSECGLGGFSISPRAVIIKCNNGLICKDDSFKKIHLGAKIDEGEIVWSQKTKQKNYELIISQTQDAIRTFLNKDYLGTMIEKIAATKNIQLEHRIDTVQHICRELSITDDHMENILQYFMSDGDPSAAGVLNAVTREAQNMPADMQFDVENNVLDTVLNIKKFDRPFSKN